MAKKSLLRITGNFSINKDTKIGHDPNPKRIKYDRKHYISKQSKRNY